MFEYSIEKKTLTYYYGIIYIMVIYFITIFHQYFVLQIFMPSIILKIILSIRNYKNNNLMEYFEFSLIISWLRRCELKHSKNSIGRKALSPIFVDAAASQERTKCFLRYVIVLTDTSLIHRVCGTSLLHREASTTRSFSSVASFLPCP